MIIFVMPVIQLLLLSNAVTYEMKNIRLHVMDFDHSAYSRELIRRMTGSGYFLLTSTDLSYKKAEEELHRGSVEIVLRIPAHFERDLIRDQKNQLQFLVNAVDGSAGNLAYQYAAEIVSDFNRHLRAELAPEWIEGQTSSTLLTTYSNWFNPEMNYKTFMVPGLLVLLVTMVGMFLAGMNIVREKEIGTIEQLNVTPITKPEFIIGKLLPFWILALIELTIGLIIGKVVFEIPIVGNLTLIYLFAAIYLLVVLGMGLLISTVTQTQQQAMFLSWFVMVLFILLSGLFTAIENMPGWAQQVTLFNPVAYFIRVMRMVMLKGSDLGDISRDLLIMALFAVCINAAAILNYRKTAA